MHTSHPRSLSIQVERMLQIRLHMYTTHQERVLQRDARGLLGADSISTGSSCLDGRRREASIYNNSRDPSACHLAAALHGRRSACPCLDSDLQKTRKWVFFRLDDGFYGACSTGRDDTALQGPQGILILPSRGVPWAARRLVGLGPRSWQQERIWQ